MELTKPSFESGLQVIIPHARWQKDSDLNRPNYRIFLVLGYMELNFKQFSLWQP